MKATTFSNAFRDPALSRLPHFRCFSVSVPARDAKCGKIQCSTSASKPIERNAVPIETTVSVGSKKFKCLGTHVYKLSQGDEEPQGDTLDPGLVMTGTKCGDDSVRQIKILRSLRSKSHFDPSPTL